MRLLSLLTAAVVFFAGTIFVLPAAAAGDGAGACREDAAKLCKDTPRGPGNIIRCLAEHKTGLSPSCKEKINAAEKNHPCAKDAERLCKEVQPGEGRMAQCMKSHEKDLSPACKSSMQKRHGRKPSRQ